MKKIVQTAGRTTLGDFAPAFAHYNDDILFEENWNDPNIDLKLRCLLTVTALIASGCVDSSLTYHLENAKKHGVTQKEIAATITHIAFYIGWPKAWAAFHLAKEIWKIETDSETEKENHARQMIVAIGEKNTAYASYFHGQSYLAPICKEPMPIYNVTFEPKCRNHWHIHQAKTGGGQILLCMAGKGYYQQWGEEVVSMKPGDCIYIPAGVKHWHGASADSWFSHLAIEVAGEACTTKWCEPVEDAEYQKLKYKERM